MAIAAPSSPLMRDVRLPFVRRSLRGGRRRLGASLSLTSMIDFLVVIVVFLLNTFHASGECCLRTVTVTLPRAANVADMVDAPVVTVLGSEVWVDGSPAGNVHALESSERLQRVDELFNLLRAKRELWKQVHPTGTFPGAVVLRIDEPTAALIVKSVFQTAVFAGYRSVSFMVMALPRTG